jgi:putative sterol carrier protein
MLRYLSPEWLDAAQAEMDSSESLPSVADGLAFVVQHVVTDGPDGDVSFHVRVDGTGVQLQKGDAPDATVVFTEDYGTAAAIARGELSAQSAFMKGRIRVSGDLAKLIEQGTAFGEIADMLARLRSDTTY